MRDNDNIDSFEPTLVSASLRYWWIVLTAAILFTVVGYALATREPDRHVATVTVVLEDPGAQVLFDSDVLSRPERYIETQVAILNSLPVAERAIQIAALSEDVAPVALVDIMEDSAIVWRGGSDVIQVSFVADDPATAAAVSNGLAVAYEEVKEAQAGEELRAALVVLDESIAQIDAQLVQITGALDLQRSAFGDRTELSRQYDAAIDRLVEVQLRSLNNPEDLSELRTEFTDLAALFDNLETVLDLEERQPEVVALLNELALANSRRAILVTRRDELGVDLGLVRSGVVLLSPVEQAEEVSENWLPATAGAAVLGLAVGVALAFSLAVRRRKFTSSEQPERVLGRPLLAAVPNFRADGLTTALPVWESGVTRSSEAFRFALSALDIKISSDPDFPSGDGAAAQSEQTSSPIGANSPDRWDGATAVAGAHSIAVLSGSPAEGKTVVAANLAIALAQTGLRVLAVDGDFGSQRMMELLNPGPQMEIGLAAVVAGEVDLVDAVAVVPLGDGRRLDVLGLGVSRQEGSEFARQASEIEWLRGLQHGYDVLIVDTAPMLHAAYAGTIARQVDQAVVVVQHGSLVSALEDLQDRLQIMRVDNVSGYVYNKDPRRWSSTKYTASVPYVDVESDSFAAQDGSVNGPARPMMDRLRSMWTRKSG